MLPYNGDRERSSAAFPAAAVTFIAGLKVVPSAAQDEEPSVEDDAEAWVREHSCKGRSLLAPVRTSDDSNRDRCC